MTAFLSQADESACITRTRAFDGLRELTFADLELLEALVATQSLSAAAEAFGMSKAGASRALARLRAATGDPLFVRSNPKLIPTREALRLACVVRDMRRAAARFAPEPVFDPQRMRRRFLVGAGENAALAFCSPVIERLEHLAPGVSMSILHYDAAHVFELLQSGELDIAFYPIRDLPPKFHSMALTTNNVVTMVREGHPLLETAKTRALAPEDLAPYRSIWVQSAVTSISVDEKNPFVRFYEGASDSDNFVLVPYFSTALALVQHTDMLMTVAKRTAQYAQKEWGGCAILPIAAQRLVDYSVRIVWHERLDADPELRWLLGIFRAAAPEADAVPQTASGDSTSRE